MNHYPTHKNPEIYNGFKVWYREAGSNSYWVARRAHRPEAEAIGLGETYTRKSKSSLVRFINSKPALR